jgi:hypothetical protein
MYRDDIVGKRGRNLQLMSLELLAGTCYNYSMVYTFNIMGWADGNHT